jgi:hypothetical protein
MLNMMHKGLKTGRSITSDRISARGAKTTQKLLASKCTSTSTLSRRSLRRHSRVRQQLQLSGNTANMTTQQGAISKRRKFVADGVFYAELNELFQRELAEEGYSGVEVRVTPTVTDISKNSTWKTRDPTENSQSSEQHTPKKSSASKVDESVNSPPSSRSASSSPRTVSPSTLPKSRTEVSQQSPSASRYDTSSLTVLRYEEHVMVF